MKRVSSTLVSAAALFVALSLTAVQAEPQQNDMSSGTPPATGNLGAGDSGGAPADGGRPGQAEQSDQMGPGQGKADAKGKSAGSLPSEGNAAKEPTGNAEAQDETARPGKGKADSTAEGGLPDEGKARTTAKGKGDFVGKAGKRARLESNDVSRVRSHFSQHKPTAQRIDRDQVSVSIGVALPGAIALYDLPPDVIVVTGACPIKYFVWDDDIVLVDSCSREVIEVIADVA